MAHDLRHAGERSLHVASRRLDRAAHRIPLILRENLSG